MSKEFTDSLILAAKKLDVPADGAKARAIAHLGAGIVASTAGAGAGVAAVAASAPAKLGALAWTVAAAAAVLGTAAGYGVGRSASAPTAKPVVVEVQPDPPKPSARALPPPPRSERADEAPATPTAAPVNACLANAIADAPPTTCSTAGKTVPIRVTNACGADVDVYWVDDKCEEVFHARLAQGESWRRMTFDHHVWRVRDHASHALLKEFTPQRVSGAPELVSKAPARVLPDVVVRGADRAKEEAPASCSSEGLPTKFRLKNDRDTQVVLMWIDHECQEKYHARIAPHRSLVINGTDGDAWRIRDAKTGELVSDVVAETPDMTTYVTVP
jgi:hypothetical protein